MLHGSSRFAYSELVIAIDYVLEKESVFEVVIYVLFTSYCVLMWDQKLKLIIFVPACQVTTLKGETENQFGLAFLIIIIIIMLTYSKLFFFSRS